MLPGVFSFLRKAAKDSPALCVEPLGVLNSLVASFAPQSMLQEPLESISSMHGFFSSLCTPDMAAAAALSDDLPEAKLVPASLSGVTSLAVARGNLTSVLAAVNTLVSHVGPEAGRAEVTLPIPQPLVTLAKVAKGATAAVTVLPGKDTLRGVTPIEYPAGEAAPKAQFSNTSACFPCSPAPLTPRGQSVWSSICEPTAP